jgi:hypothetical protein
MMVSYKSIAILLFQQKSSKPRKIVRLLVVISDVDVEQRDNETEDVNKILIKTTNSRR